MERILAEEETQESQQGTSHASKILQVSSLWKNRNDGYDLKVETSIGNTPIEWNGSSYYQSCENMFWLIHDDNKFAGKPPTNSYIW